MLYRRRKWYTIGMKKHSRLDSKANTDTVPEPTAAKKRWHLDTKGIQFRSWLAFFLFGLFIIAFLWLTQVVYLENYTTRTKKQEFSNISRDLIEVYAGPDYRHEFARIANRNGCTVDILHIDGDIATVVYSSSDYIFGASGQIAARKDLWDKLAQSAQYGNGSQQRDTEAQQMLYGVYLNEERTELLVVAQSTLLIDNTIRIMHVQMLIVTITIIVLSFCLSFIMSGTFSMDIRRLSDTAHKLVQNDYNVRFVEKGFTEARELAVALNYATAEMQQTEQLRRELLANVSHDLRTPLTIIKGYAEMLRDISGGNAQLRDKQLGIIVKEADRLSGLVNDLLQLSAVQNQTEAGETQPIDLSSMVERAAQSFDLLVQRDGYTLQLDITPHVWVQANAKQLELAVYNLVANAFNYTGDDKFVSLSVTTKDNMACFGVQDHGDGLSEQQKQQIWQRYYRAKEHKRAVAGTGLGLTIVSNVLRLHNAQYGVQSEVGSGSLFWFRLPLVPAPDTTIQD